MSLTGSSIFRYFFIRSVERRPNINECRLLDESMGIIFTDAGVLFRRTWRKGNCPLEVLCITGNYIKPKH